MLSLINDVITICCYGKILIITYIVQDINSSPWLQNIYLQGTLNKTQKKCYLITGTCPGVQVVGQNEIGVTMVST